MFMKNVLTTLYKFIGRFCCLLVLLVVAGATVLFLVTPNNAEAAPAHTTAANEPAQAHDPPHICAPGYTPDTDYGCFMPDSTTCMDGECFKCDITTCMSAPAPPGIPTDKDSSIANNVPLPASKNNTMFFFTRLDLTVQHPIVLTMWWWVLGAVDVLIIFTIMLQGIRIMITGSVFRYADAAQAIPNILLALVAAQFSILIITAFLDLNNAISLETYNWANNNDTFKGVAWGKITSCKDSVINKGEEPKSGNQVRWLKPKDEDYMKHLDNVINKDDIVKKIKEDPNAYNSPKDPQNYPLAINPHYYKWVFRLDPQTKQPNPEFDREQFLQFAGTAFEGIPHLPVSPSNPKNRGIDPKVNQYYLVYAVQQECKSWQNDIDELFTLMPTIDGPGLWDKVGAFFHLAWESLTDFLKLVGSLSMLALIGQMLLRFLLLNLYIVISPMGLASWALPGHVGRPLTQAWLKGFISLALVQFLQVMGLIVAHSIAGGAGKQVIDALGKDGQNDVVRWIMAITFVWFILRIPGLIGTTPLSTMLEVGQKTTQTAGAVVQHNTALIGGIAGFL
ncbi:MAG: hypothetical protein J2P36_02155 [Ktedonobacteraceae bacterium]|nr:hypothetical protein [Ktedonobacteraceae bacterium]